MMQKICKNTMKGQRWDRKTKTGSSNGLLKLHQNNVTLQLAAYTEKLNKSCQAWLKLNIFS